MRRPPKGVLGGLAPLLGEGRHRAGTGMVSLRRAWVRWEPFLGDLPRLLNDTRASIPGLRRTVRRFAPHLRKQARLIAGGSAAMVAEIMFRLLEPWPLKLILDRVIQPDPQRAATGLGFLDRMEPGLLLVLSAVAVVLFTGVRALASYLSTLTFALAGNRVLTEVRGDLYRHLQRLSLSFHTRARRGDLLTRVTGDVGRLQEVLITAALPLTVNTVTLFGMLAVMLWVNVQLALIALAAFPVFLLTMLRLTRRIRAAARKQRRVEGELASTASESLGAIKVIQSYSLERRFEESFSSQNRRSLKDGVQAKRLSAGLERKTDLLVAITTGAVLLVGARLVLAGSITPGDLILFIAYLKSAFKPMRDLAKYTGRLAKAAASGERIIELLDTDPGIKDRPGAWDAPALGGEVRFERVSLAYDPEREVLRNLDLHVLPGQTIGVVGRSGAGKSSLVGLLLRLYDPDQGKVMIDGMDIRDLTLGSLRSHIGIVLQDSVLFATTIRENIAYGAEQATDAEIEEAARLANAHDFIARFPEGYDTVVGEQGATLSGGERQRIAIARAAIRRPPIIVLDEPTNGLDGENEGVVIEALRRLSDGKTTFHIAHDLHTVQDADRIIYLKEGEVLESGTHEQLLRQGGRYAAMYAVQSRSRVASEAGAHAGGG